MEDTHRSLSDSHLIWENVESETQYDAGILRLRRVRRRSPSGKHAPFISVDAPNWVTVIPELKEGKSLLIVRQYRHGTQEVGSEFPAGAIDSGESPTDAALRELNEETGYGASEIREIGSVSPNPAFMTNRTYTFLARGLSKNTRQNLDEHEILDVMELPYSEIAEQMGQAPFDSAITVQAWFFYQRARQCAR